MNAPTNPFSLPPSKKVNSYIRNAIDLLKQKKKDEAYQYLEDKIGDANKKDKISINYAIYDLFRKINPSSAHKALDLNIKIDPLLTLPLLLKARLFEEHRDASKAVEVLDRFMKLKPTHQELVEAARILSRYGNQKLALKAAKDAYFGSGQDITLSTYPLRVALQNADWDTSEAITSKLLAAHKNNESDRINETPRTHLLWCADEQINKQVIQNFSGKIPKSTKPPLIDVPDGDISQRKIRIGYLSNDFRDHPTSYLVLGMLRHHNKSRFDIYLYDTSYDDSSAMRRNIFSRANYVRDLSKTNDEMAASIIFKDKIDVLVDLNGLTDGSRVGIFSYRPAPVQMSYLGFPGSTGLSTVDYIIADEYTVPKTSDIYYSESIIRIPHTYQINDFIAQYLPPRPNLKNLGLPNNKIIIGMFNNVNKVGREVWDTWMKIMSSAPESVLWMLDPGEEARNNLMNAAKKFNVMPDRFFWSKKLSQEEHLARLQHCSIALDPWPYGGHTTTSDALFAGVPVVALEGSNFPSRVSGGLLRAAGLGSLIGKSLDDYIKIALRLIHNKNSLSVVKKHLVLNRGKHPIFDAIGRTKYIESAYIYACSAASKKNIPTSFQVNVSPKSKKGS